MIKHQLLILSLLFLAGCANHSLETDITQPISSSSQQNIQAHNRQLSDPQLTQQKLLVQYQIWQGAPYQLGGLSKQGIDCSGFVFLTFLNQFNIKLPRTTLEQKRIGNHVSKEKLVAGDLIFFKTGKNKNHVGIYLDELNFIHVSTSQGVKISSLDNQYWSRNYWFARRVE